MSRPGLRILIVDDDADIRRQMRWAFEGAEIHEAANRAEAIAATRRVEPDVVLLDLGLPPAPHDPSEGLRTLEEIKRLRPAARVVVITGQDDRPIARSAVMRGASDFFAKPIDLDDVRLVVRRAAELAALEQEASAVAAADDCAGIKDLIAASPQMRTLCAAVARVARTSVSVLLMGESGTGKEVIARGLHDLSPRRDKPFIAINCAAIPEPLLEAELFGHEKGAFTGAYRQNAGKIELAEQGTLFLDEIGELALGLQAKLLRFLEERAFDRIGGRKRIHVDVRILTATNRDLREAIARGQFREDLFYRLHEVGIAVPPLRERTGDAVLLAQHFLAVLPAQLDVKPKKLSPRAMAAIGTYAWPGNVRELQNRTKRALIMSPRDLLEPEDFELAAVDVEGHLPTLRDGRRKTERELVVQALIQSQNNVSEAAKLLGISRPTLYELMRALDLTPPAARS